jgi:hypothetical protein
MKQKIPRSERIPKYGTKMRTILVSEIANLPGYQEGLRKGFPLFTKEELDDFKELYKKDGLTWEDIDQILSGKGIFFKKATFRKYIQDGNISKAIGYRNTEKGRVAIFPADTISHINFIQYYYKVMDGEHADNIIELIKDQQISYFDAIESNLTNYDNLHASIDHYIFSEDGDVSSAIDKALSGRPADRDKFLKMLDDIDDKFNKSIRKDIDKLVSLLKKKTISVYETMDGGKEAQDEQN